MNDRIMQLVKQAELDLHNATGQTWGIHPAIAKRFAGLVVKECVRYFNEDYKRDFDELWREDLSKGIKQHFGVE